MSEKSRHRSLSQALNAGVRKYGTAIVSNLAIAIKTTQLYSFEHQNVVDALKELGEFIRSFIRLEGEVELSRVEDFLFINEVRIRVDLGGLQTYEFVLGLMKERDIGSLAFSGELADAQLKKLVDLLTRPVGGPQEPWKSFDAELQKLSLADIKAKKYEVPQEQSREINDDKRMLAIQLYFRTIRYMKDSFGAVRAGRKINLKRLKRTVQGMVDVILEDEPTLLALINIKNHDSPAANHAVNVAVVSVALGSRLGFSKKLLGDLGIAALLHDLGKCRLPEELLDRDPAGLEGEARRQIEDHVYGGVEVLLNQRIVDAVVKSMNVAFLHHFRFDSTGFPRTHVVKEQNFYSRIVALANRYDNSTTPRGGKPAPFTPDRAMRLLMDGSSSEFDPLVVKAFVNLMGLYPVGCVVQLDTGELATVVGPATNPRFLDRPKVRIFCDGDGGTVDESADLLEREGDRFPRSILKLYQQEEVALEMEEYLSVI